MKRSEVIKIIKQHTNLDDEKAQLLLLALEEAGLAPVHIVKQFVYNKPRVYKRVSVWEDE